MLFSISGFNIAWRIKYPYLAGSQSLLFYRVTILVHSSVGAALAAIVVVAKAAPA